MTRSAKTWPAPKLLKCGSRMPQKPWYQRAAAVRAVKGMRIRVSMVRGILDSVSSAQVIFAITLEVIEFLLGRGSIEL